MKKPIQNYENYFIFNDGSVLNSTTNKILSGSIGKNGYRYYRLSKNGKKKMFYAHRLVAEAFLKNPDNLPIVNHIDGNKLNNNVCNLEWTTYSSNTAHFHSFIRKNHENKKQEKYIKDLENEIWTMTNNPNYRVSSCGRVHNIKTNNILHPSDTCGYYKVRLSFNGETKDFLVHNLIFQSFHPEIDISNKQYCIDHIDGNKHNNSLNNLRLITLSENVMAAYYTQKNNSNIKPVSQYTKEEEFIATFPSSREASRQLKLDSSSITKCCKGKLKTTGGFIFKYA